MPESYHISATCLTWTEEPSNLSFTLPISSVHQFNKHENICNFQPQIFQKLQGYCLFVCFFPSSAGGGTQKTVTDFKNYHVLSGSAHACPQHQPHLSAWLCLLLSSFFLSLSISLSLCFCLFQKLRSSNLFCLYSEMFVETPVALNAFQFLPIYLHCFFGQNMIDLNEVLWFRLCQCQVPKNNYFPYFT